MKRDSFIFYKSFYESIKELEPKEQVEIYNAIFEYQFEGKEPKLSGISKSIFTLILPQLEANNKRFLNGCKGGAPKGNQNASKNKPKNNQKTTKKQPNVNVNDNEKEYFNNKEVNEIFKEFLSLRKKIKAVNSDRAINNLIKKLNKYDDNTKIKMIDKSITNSWKDVYEIKEEQGYVELKQDKNGGFYL